MAAPAAAILTAPARRIAVMPVPLLVGLFCLVVYLHKPLVQSSLDNQPLRWGATLLATGRPLDYAKLGLPPNSYYSFRDTGDGRIRSHTPVGTAFLAAPFFAAARALGVPFTSGNVVFLDSLLATLLTAASAGMMAHLARRQGRRTAFFVGLAFGLGTAAYAVASRTLWQHTGQVFALLAGMCLLDAEKRSLERTALGVAMLALAAWCRPYVAPAIALLVLWEMRRGWKAALAVGAVVALAVGVWVLFNLRTTGNLLGTYVSSRVLQHEFWKTYSVSLWGTLASPNRGMFVFSPLLLMGVPAMVWHLARAHREPYKAVLALAVLAVVLPRGAFHGWFGGHTYGSRYMLDCAPFLMLLMAPFLHHALEVRRVLAVVPVALFLVSAGIQYLGATRDFESWNILMGMNTPANAWNRERTQIAHCLTRGESTRGPLRSAVRYALPPDGVINVSRDMGNEHVRYGISYQPPHGAQVMPPGAGLVFFTPKPDFAYVSLQLTGPVYPVDPTRIECLLNGRVFHTEVVKFTDWEFKRSTLIEVEGSRFVDGLNLMEFRVNRVFYPAASAAPFGVTIGKVVIRPVRGGVFR